MRLSVSILSRTKKFPCAFIGSIFRPKRSGPDRAAGRGHDGLGLVDEVDSLLRAGVDEDSTPMRSVGYREIVRYLRREMTLDEATAAIIGATWKYARRQRTWLRRKER